MYISGAKFKENCSNISGHILNSVFYSLRGAVYGVITFLICIIQKHESKDNPKRKLLFFFTLKSLSNKQQLFFTS